MKKFVLSVLTVLSCGAVYALPAGNPAEASLYSNSFWFDDSCYDQCDPCDSWCDWFDLRLGFYGDYVYNRHLESQGNNDASSGLDKGGDVQDTTIFTNAGSITLNFCDWFDAFATIGVSNFHIRSESSIFTTPAATTFPAAEIGFSPAMSYSGGLRATIWQCDCFYIGGMAQYFYSKTKQDYYMEYSTGRYTYFNENRSADYQEWQVAIGAAYIFENSANFAFIPYANIEVAGVNWNLRADFPDTASVETRFGSLVEKKVVGWSLGMTALLCDLIGVTVEGRWANEKALHVNGQLSF
ncbi:MAG: Major outer membrane porin [Chlamydiales bacterium]|nr:Major outer membrane porin [Chlamydiales bacterium]